MKTSNNNASKKKNNNSNPTNSTVDYKYSPQVETPNPKAKASAK
jgi:hypothetical protein